MLPDQNKKCTIGISVVVNFLLEDNSYFYLEKQGKSLLAWVALLCLLFSTRASGLLEQIEITICKKEKTIKKIEAIFAEEMIFV
jgi:hypothetical protein